MRRMFAPMLAIVLLLGILVCPIAARAEGSDRYDPDYIKMIEQKNMTREEIYRVFGPGADGVVPAADDSETLSASRGITASDPYTGAVYDHGNKLTGAKLLYGVDVSKWQGDVDWAKVKAAGISFAFIRLGHSWTSSGESNEDPYYKKNIAAAAQAGLKVGVYYFSQAINEDEARREARFVLDLLGGRALDLPVMFDYESSPNYRNYSLSKASGTQIARTFCEAIRKGGYRSGIYANTDFFRDKLYGDQLDKENTVWIARYNTYVYANDYTGYIPNYSFWQYAGSDVNYNRGHVPGIGGSTTYSDLDYWYYRGEDLSSHPVVSTPTPETKPTVSAPEPETKPTVTAPVPETKPTVTAPVIPVQPVVKRLQAPVMKSITNEASCVRVTWNAVADCKRYRVFRSSGGSDWKTLGDTASTVFDDASAVSGTTYSYTVCCLNPDGTDVVSDRSAKSMSLLCVGAVMASNITLHGDGNGMQVRWRAVDKAESYIIYRSKSGGKYSKIATVDGKVSEYLDKKASYGVTYTYAVRAKIGTVMGAYSGRSGCRVAPVYDSLVKASNVASGVKVQWSKRKGASGYVIYRGTSAGNLTKLATVSGSKTDAYTDVTAVSGVRYVYSVCGINGNDTGDRGSVTITAVGAVLASGIRLKNEAGGLRVDWNPVNGAESYRIYRRIGGGKYALAAQVNASTAPFIQDTNVISGKTYSYDICAVIGGSEGVRTAKSLVRLAPLTADKLTLTGASGGVIINWRKVAGAAGYHIYRRVGDGEYTLLKDIKGASKVKFTDQTVVNGQRYTYKVEPFKGAVTGVCEGRQTVFMQQVIVASMKNTAPGTASIVLSRNNPLAEKYEMQISTSSRFAASSTQTRYVSFANLTETIQGLTRGKSCYVRIRAVKTVDGVTYTSGWSSKKSVKIKI